MYYMNGDHSPSHLNCVLIRFFFQPDPCIPFKIWLPVRLYFQVIFMHLAVPGQRFPTRQLLIIIANYLTIKRSGLEAFVIIDFS